MDLSARPNARLKSLDALRGSAIVPLLRGDQDGTRFRATLGSARGRVDGGFRLELPCRAYILAVEMDRATITAVMSVMGKEGGKLGGKRTLEAMTLRQPLARAKKASAAGVAARAKKAAARNAIRRTEP